MLAPPAVHQHRAHFWRPGCRGSPHEGQDREGVLRNPHVRPLSVVILDHNPFVLTTLGIALLTLGERRRERSLSRQWAFWIKKKKRTQETRPSTSCALSECSWLGTSPLVALSCQEWRYRLAGCEVSDVSEERKWFKMWNHLKHFVICLHSLRVLTSCPDSRRPWSFALRYLTVGPDSHPFSAAWVRPSGACVLAAAVRPPGGDSQSPASIINSEIQK